MIYFDSAATTKPHQEVLDAYLKVNKDYWLNPSSMYQGSQETGALINKAEKQIKELLQIEKTHLYFTSGATEANNMAIMGFCKKYINQNKHLITTEIEHPSVYNTFKELEKLGFNVTYLKCKNGVVDLEQLKDALTKDTILVSIMWVNNIIGSINPIKEIIEIVKNASHAKLHVDLVQGLTKIIPDFNFDDLDMFSFTFHKIEGLKSIGVLACKNNLDINPLLYGGHQQNEKRPGTLDAALIVSSSKALRLAIAKQKEHFYYVQQLYNYLLEKLQTIKNIKLNKTDTLYSPYVLSISFDNIKGETVLHYLEKEGIYVGIGSACNEKTKTIERAVQAITNDEKRSINMIRISLSYHNTKEEIDILINKLESIGNL